MTFREWLSKHNYAVRFQPRGFEIENEYGEKKFVQVIAYGVRVMKYVSDDDVVKWLKRNIHDSFFNAEAQDDFYILA